MKKIKGLLLFGILTLLGIGSSFGYVYVNYQFEFKSNNNNNILFNVNPGNSNISTLLMTYQDINGNRNSLDILRKSSTTSNNLFNISSYSVTSYSPSYSYSTAKLYSSSSCLDLSVTGSSNQLLFHLFGDNNCNSTSNGTIGSREVYINVGDSCINSGVMNTGNCDYGFYKYFGFNGTFDSRFDSLIQDNQYSGSNAGKTSISFPFPDAYSFFNSVAWSGTGPYELPSVYIINQKYIYHTGDTFSALNGFYVARINDLNSTFENSDFKVIALDLHGSGTLSDLYFTYGIFDCPYSAQDILDCSFNDGGTISNLYTANSITGNVLQFLTTREGFSAGSTYNYFSNFLRNKLSTDGTLTFYRFLAPNSATSSNAPRWLSTSVQLVSDGNNYFQDLFPSGNGNQSFPDPILDGGVFDANTFLIEESIKCYLTSGEVCNSPFTYENSTNYVNNYDHQERVRNSTDKTGYLTFNNSVDMLSQYCLNVNTIQYAFCSQLYLYEGSPITYYYNNGYFNYIISGSGREVNLGTLWSGQLGYAYCEGPFCSNFNEGLPQFIRKDTGVYSDFGFSGEYVSLDFFKNYFENGFFFQCPFSYSGSYFTIGSKLIDRLDKHDPLKPINCMIAGFSHGIKSSFFGDSKLGLSHSGVLMNNTGPNATRFYTFLDILLSLGYIFFFSKLFKFLKKH